MSKRGKRVKCIIPECEETISENSKYSTCGNCRRGLNYWDKRGAAKVLQRRYQLRKLNARLTEIIGEKGNERED